MALTKADIATKLSKNHKLLKRVTEKFVDSFFEIVGQNLANGKNIKFSGFGNFILRDKVARPGRNPKTGKVVTVTARRVVTFHAGDKLRERVKLLQKK